MAGFSMKYMNTKHRANLQMAPKLTPSSLYPGNNKQNVELAPAIFQYPDAKINLFFCLKKCLLHHCVFVSKDC